MGWLFLLALALAGAGLWLLWRARGQRRQAGLPAGRLVYVDTGAWNRCERPMFSNQYRLTGRPDYLVTGREGVIPVEVKSGVAPAAPYVAHVLQLAAYCLLVEEQEHCRPPHGIIKYDDRAFEIEYTPALRARLLATLDAIRADLWAGDVEPNHHEPGRCRGCGQRTVCGRRLA
ncbi:MAG: CRISPR-associated protein Cas4 [Anaerolineaceae bacterium]|nr:CRISPR-associated protein Cas4 [Anaerolineaceae bacterium]